MDVGGVGTQFGVGVRSRWGGDMRKAEKENVNHDEIGEACHSKHHA